MLIIVRKSGATKNQKTSISVLKRLPSTLSEAKEMANEIKNSNEDWEDERISIKLYDYQKLQNDLDNWFKFVAVQRHELVDLHDQIIKGTILKTLESFGQIVRGYEMMGGRVTKLIVNTDSKRAIKANDIWVLKKRGKAVLQVSHRATTALEFEVPLSAVHRA